MLMDISGLVVRDGDHVRASGRVVAVAGSTWFEPPLPVPAIRYAPGHEPAPRPSGFGVQAIGVDLADLADRREQQGAIEGWATLTGTWQQDRLVVGGQDPPNPARRAWVRWKQPPCPPPAGGWPEGDLDENLDLAPELEPAASRIRASMTGDADDSLDPPPQALAPYDAITSIAIFRPSRRRAVLVVAAGDPQRVEAALRPHYGARLCVVPSRWTHAQIDDVTRRLPAQTRPWMIYEWGRSVGEGGQALVVAYCVRVLPAFAGWASAVPPGLLSVTPWLAPQPRPAP